MNASKRKLVKASMRTVLLVLIVAVFGIPSLHSKNISFADSTLKGISNSASTSKEFSPEPHISIPEGMVPSDPFRVYNRKNVFELINGQAELYLSAGFKRLLYQRMAKEEDPEFWIEQFVYDMGSVRNAFAVFSMQRREDGKPLKLASFAYDLDTSLYLAHGPYYLEIIASRDTDEASDLMRSMAEDFIRQNEVEVEPITALSLFPRANLVEKSFTLIPSNVFGTEALNQIYTARYKLGATEVTAFLSPRKSRKSAKEQALKYYKFLKDFGAKDLDLEAQIGGARLVDILDAYELIFTVGHYLAGIHEATIKEQAVKLGALIAKRLKGVVGEESSRP